MSNQEKQFIDRVSFKYRNEDGDIVSVSLKEIKDSIGWGYAVPSNVLGLTQGELLDIEVDGEVVKGVLYVDKKPCSSK